MLGDNMDMSNYVQPNCINGISKDDAEKVREIPQIQEDIDTITDVTIPSIQENVSDLDDRVTTLENLPSGYNWVKLTEGTITDLLFNRTGYYTCKSTKNMYFIGYFNSSNIVIGSFIYHFIPKGATFGIARSTTSNYADLDLSIGFNKFGIPSISGDTQNKFFDFTAVFEKNKLVRTTEYVINITITNGNITYSRTNAGSDYYFDVYVSD